MSRMAEYVAELPDRDLEEADLHQAEMEHRKREEAAIAHARPLQDELKQMIEQSKR